MLKEKVVKVSVVNITLMCVVNQTPIINF